MEAQQVEQSTTQGFEAFAVAQGQFNAALKDANNPFFKSKYADLASIWDAVKLPLSSNGLSITQPIRTTEGGAYFVETILRYKDGAILERCMCPVIAKSQNDPQALGSAITYARRYALASLLCIVTDDDDGESATGRAEPQAAPKQQTQQREPYAKPATKPVDAKVTALDKWNKSVGAMLADSDRKVSPEAYMKATEVLKGIDGLSTDEIGKNFKALVKAGKEHGVLWDNEKKDFYVEEPTNEELSNALADNG